jgi:hypothetical protein
VRTKVSFEEDRVRIILIPEDDDILVPSEKYRMYQREFSMHLPEGFRDIHPDLLALATLLVVNPFVGTRLVPPLKVSSRFQIAANSVLSRYKISDHVDPLLSPREQPLTSTPMLAFSGGVDSTAALSVMPKNTISIFMDRPMRGKSLYNPQAAHYSVKSLREIGYHTESVQCDLEYVRHPVGFPTDLSNGVPGIMLADYFKASSIAFGTVLESAYGIGHERYKDYPIGAHYTFYSTLFNAVGLHLSMPMAGVSEVGTAMIVEKSPIGFVAQSCIRGTMNKPCLKCWKCFRKSTLGRALYLDSGSSASISSLLSKEVNSKLLDYPISHENVIAFSMRRYPREENNSDDLRILDTLLQRVKGLPKLDFLTRWYMPSQILVHSAWREDFKQKIFEFLEVMPPKESSEIESWSMSSFLADPSTISSYDQLVELFEKS